MFNKIFDKLAAQETSFMSQDFFSPVISSKPIRVKIAGVVMNLTVTKPKNFTGWGVFRPLTFKTARKIRDANMQEKRTYLKLFPTLRLIVCSRNEEQWFGIPSSNADTRFRITGLVPIRLSEELQMFQTVKTSFDGSNCWFDQVDMNANMKNATVLREALSQMTDIAKVTSSGLSKEEKQAYASAFIRELENRKDRNEEKIKDALNRAGAEYRSYVERGDQYTVEFVVGGETHRSTVKKDNLQVQSAGICLSGYDKNFDLQSLVGVIREGINRHKIVRVGNDDLRDTSNDYDDYDD